MTENQKKIIEGSQVIRVNGNKFSNGERTAIVSRITLFAEGKINLRDHIWFNVNKFAGETWLFRNQVTLCE